MKNTISIITAVLPEKSQFLEEAYDSICAQELPSDWTWEWSIRVDGPSGMPIEARLRMDKRIHLGRNSVTRGPAIARTLALGQGNGQVVKVLDADDRLIAGQLAREVSVYDSHPTVTWTTCRVLDLLPDGSHAGFPGDPAPGRLRRGEVYDYWTNKNGRASVHPATLSISRTAIEGLGGWMALPASEDTGLLLTLDALYDGWFFEEAGLLYRKWEGQLTATAEHNSNEDRAERFEIIRRRLAALNLSG